MTTEVITIDIIPGQNGAAPTVRASATLWQNFGEIAAADMLVGDKLSANTDPAMVARAMLQAAAYLFAQGQPVQFGREIPLEVLR